MKTILLTLFLALLISFHAKAQCLNGESEVSFTMTSPSADLWIYAYDAAYIVNFYSQQVAFSGNFEDSFCIPSDGCIRFIIYDNVFESVLDIDYTISVDGNQEVNESQLVYSVTHMINCPEGSMCETPLFITGDGTFTATSDDTWYSYTPSSTGLYHISTCNNNTCDTKIWVYASCPWNIVEGPPGTYAFNDDHDCGDQADTDISLEGGNTYFIRIGDNLDDCPDPIEFTFNYVGLIAGCMDENACNFNPLAQTEGECLYFPNALCSAPDLQMNVETLLTSLSVMNVQATACDVEEGMVTGDGVRTVITFSVRIDNVGDADYYIGNPADNPEMFETQNCHGHVHYAGYGDYRLMDMQGNIIPAGHKNGFCVMDLCGFGQYNCGTMGISAGCYDQYGAGTSGQWFDVTDVPDGTYRGLVTVNPLHLADGLGHPESNYENNTYVFCFDLGTNGFGRTITLLSDCPAFYDCLGVLDGTATIDCEGICDGPSIWGDVVSDSDLNSTDMPEYLSMLAQENVVVTTCNDLSGNGSLTIYDLALASICVGESEQGGTSACNFPHNILSGSGPCGMAITNVNFIEGYIDVELKSTSHDIIAYQFSMDGIVISSVQSLADNTTFPCTVSFNPYTNNIFGLADYGFQLQNSGVPSALCRIYYSQILTNTICISGITDIVNNQRSRTANYIYGDCFDATAFSTNEIVRNGEISLMPNPVTNTVTIGLDRFVTAPKELLIRDQVGKLIQVIRIAEGVHTLTMDMGELSPGIYTIGCEERGVFSSTRRFVKL